MKAANKARRLIEIENLLLSNPEGMTQAEIARSLNVNRSTITRDIPSFSENIYFDEDGRWKIDRTAELIHVRLTLHETLALHLASRLLATCIGRKNPHMNSALRKLAVAMQRWARPISQHIDQTAGVMGDITQIDDPIYLKSLERLTQAWAEQRKVWIWRHSDRTGKIERYLVSPYFIEPYAIGRTTMLIGLSEPPGELRTYKIERIDRVEITGDCYEIPDDFKPEDLFTEAWGIWFTGEAPVEVVLRFSPRVARRVWETRWHRSEQVTELEDGSLLWKARISEPKEMMPWIRGWGSDVEVLEPVEMREGIKREVENLHTIYNKES